MSGRSLSGGVTSALAAPHVIRFPLVDLFFDAGTTYVCGAAHDVVYNGHTYSTLLGLGGVEPIEETDAEVKGLAFVLSGVPQSSIAIALSTEVQGRAVIVRMAFIDSAGVLQVDDNLWTGYLDQMLVNDDVPSATIRVTAEHKMARYDQPKIVRFSNEDQQVISAGDKYWEFAPQVSEQVIYWPSKEFFKT